jgi:P27 family predicted phage terminase small subunit
MAMAMTIVLRRSRKNIRSTSNASKPPYRIEFDAFIKLLKGTLRRDRTNILEPKPAFDDLNPPFRLSKVAKAHWDHIKPALVESRVLTNVDTSALAYYCETFAIWKAAHAKVLKEGSVIAGPGGKDVKNPHWVVATKSQELMLSMLREFGLTPASRSKVLTHSPAVPENRFDKFRKPQ